MTSSVGFAGAIIAARTVRRSLASNVSTLDANNLMGTLPKTVGRILQMQASVRVGLYLRHPKELKLTQLKFLSKRE